MFHLHYKYINDLPSFLFIYSIKYMFNHSCKQTQMLCYYFQHANLKIHPVSVFNINRLTKLPPKYKYISWRNELIQTIYLFIYLFTHFSNLQCTSPILLLMKKLLLHLSLFWNVKRDSVNPVDEPKFKFLCPIWKFGAEKHLLQVHARRMGNSWSRKLNFWIVFWEKFYRKNWVWNLQGVWPFSDWLLVM